MTRQEHCHPIYEYGNAIYSLSNIFERNSHSVTPEQKNKVEGAQKFLMRHLSIRIRQHAELQA